MLGFAKKFLGSPNDRQVRDFMAQGQRINALEPKMEGLSDDAGTSWSWPAAGS